MGCAGAPPPADSESDTDTGLVDARTGWTFGFALADGTWTPAWMGDPIAAAFPSRPLALSLSTVTPDELVVVLQDRNDDPCRIWYQAVAWTWADPTFVTGPGSLSRINLGDEEQVLIVESSEATRAYGSVDMTLSGAIASDGSEVERLEVLMLVSAEYLDWTGLGDVDAVCARADLEGTPCVPCGEAGTRCLSMQVTDLPTPRVADAPTAPGECE